jgi:predicted GNAT superfamily acetyltransferase
MQTPVQRGETVWTQQGLTSGAVTCVGDVTVRELVRSEEHHAAEALLSAIWSGEGAERPHSPVTANLMRAFHYGGSYVAGAFEGERMAGASIGFVAMDGGDGRAVLHSHVTGVAAGFRGRGVGLALKTHQHQWARGRGLASVVWTFDPLVRRNAHFNLATLGALGATAPRYLVDFYGDMPDAVNAGQGSDRLLVDWSTRDRPPPGGASDRLDAERLLWSGPDGEPVHGAHAGHSDSDADHSDRAPSAPGPASAVGADRAVHVDRTDRTDRAVHVDRAGAVLVQTPADIESTRGVDPARALRWRFALREALVDCLNRGLRITGFTADGCYVLAPPAIRRSA